MQKLSIILLILITSYGCSNPIKNEDAKVVVEPGTAVTEGANKTEKSESKPIEDKTEITNRPVDKNDLYGYYVGYFEQDVDKEKDKKYLKNEIGINWNKENKINISIDQIKDDSTVVGHSVVAGNDRPFKGSVKKSISEKDGAEVYTFSVREPGDDRYDGEFKFSIENGRMIGKWEAYKNINIKKRKYNLEKRKFEYNPKIMLQRGSWYADWTNVTEEEITEEYDNGEFETYIKREFASSSPIIFSMNASSSLLDEDAVANLTKGDLIIIRNTIYARHGYSFRNLPLRVFFDAQDWYIPVHADIRSDFTDIEKTNIELLLAYEEYASNYYDSYGR